jgi:hypothetical protein
VYDMSSNFQRPKSHTRAVGINVVSTNTSTGGSLLDDFYAAQGQRANSRGHSAGYGGGGLGSTTAWQGGGGQSGSRVGSRQQQRVEAVAHGHNTSTDATMFSDSSVRVSRDHPSRNGSITSAGSDFGHSLLKDFRANPPVIAYDKHHSVTRDHTEEYMALSMNERLSLSAGNATNSGDASVQSGGGQLHGVSAFHRPQQQSQLQQHHHPSSGSVGSNMSGTSLTTTQTNRTEHSVRIPPIDILYKDSLSGGKHAIHSPEHFVVTKQSGGDSVAQSHLELEQSLPGITNSMSRLTGTV